MIGRLGFIVSCLESLENIQITEPLREIQDSISGKIAINESGIELEFETVILPQYPMQSHEIETIRFINRSLISYNHVNADGSICIHTLHNPDLKSKLFYDIEGLRLWIRKYYIHKNSDKHYEHLIVNENSTLNPKVTFLFTEVNHIFKDGEFGFFKYSYLARGKEGEKDSDTFLVNGFIINKTISTSTWSSFYNNRELDTGIFLFLDKAPLKRERFLIENWNDLNSIVKQDFMSFFYKIKKFQFGKFLHDKYIPLLIGYKIPENEIHWQCALIDIHNFPSEGKDLGTTKGWIGQFKNFQIIWSTTKNCSYKYFFGRGKLSNSLTDKKIIIIGIGAIGSIVACTLARGGCRSIALADYDIKLPENVCRSEYLFNTGINNKVLDLSMSLIQISPFLEVIPYRDLMDAIKYFINNRSLTEDIRKRIEEYDLILDCTADNDIAYILDALSVSSDVISISIANKAKALFCSTKPELYKWLNAISQDFNIGNEEMYEPTGCWSPTFRASYNDISTLVQFAVKHINLIMEEGKKLRPFNLIVDQKEELNINLHQF
jgi:hypothetical protein